MRRPGSAAGWGAGEPFVHVRAAASGWEIRGLSDGALGYPEPGAGSPRPGGAFARWSWDGARLVAENDRYGLFPLYYFARGDEVCLSPSILQLLAQGASPELDDGGMAVFLRLGYFVGEDTPFREIRLLPPNASFEWSEGRLRVEGGFPQARPRTIGRSQAIDTYVELFRAALRKRLPSEGQVVLPLSGGRDSRHILLELCQLGRPPDLCVTLRHFPPRNNSDAALARSLAEAAGVKHVVLDQDQPWLVAERWKNVQTSFCSFDHSWLWRLSRYLCGTDSNVFDGLAGDVLSAGVFMDEDRLAFYRAGDVLGFATHLLDHSTASGEVYLSRLLAPAAYRRFSRSEAMQRLTREAARHADLPNPVASFMFWNRTRRVAALAPYTLFKQVRHVSTPFVDHDVYDFLTSLPGEMIVDHTFHDDAIARAYPGFAQIPYEDKSEQVRDKAFFRRLALDVTRYCAARRAPSLRPTYALSRLLLHGLRGSAELVWLVPHLVYLTQLEELAAERGRIDLAGTDPIGGNHSSRALS